jgi:acetyl esterase/lipase
MITTFTLIATACSSGEADQGNPLASADSTVTTEVSSTTQQPATTTLEPSTTTTAAAVTTVPSVHVDAKYSVVVTTGLIGEDTQEITAWAPNADGSWPVVYALPGWGGRGSDLGETATALASQGVVVFASDYRWDAWEQGRWQDLTLDTECGHRYVRSIADEYGDDPDQPVTLIGHSFGATMALSIGLNGPAYGPDGTYEACFEGVPRPDVIVPLGSCVYELEGTTFNFDPSSWQDPNLDTDLVSVSRSEDVTCETWQSADATAAYQEVGFKARHVDIDGANHYNLVLYDLVDGEWFALPDNPGGLEAVQTILEAIAAAQPG